MNEYRIDIKVRNNLILDRISKMGYSSPYEFCKEINISYPTLLKYINLRKSIYTRGGTIVPSIIKLCEKLKCSVEELFTLTQMEQDDYKKEITLKVNEAEMKYMMESAQNQFSLDNLSEKETKENLVEKMINKLPTRYQKVINMRFGLGEFNEPHSLEECSKKFNVTRERIRQMESKALRHLRCPRNHQEIKQLIDLEEEGY